MNLNLKLTDSEKKEENSPQSVGALVQNTLMIEKVDNERQTIRLPPLFDEPRRI